MATDPARSGTYVQVPVRSTFCGTFPVGTLIIPALSEISLVNLQLRLLVGSAANLCYTGMQDETGRRWKKPRNRLFLSPGGKVCVRGARLVVRDRDVGWLQVKNCIILHFLFVVLKLHHFTYCTCMTDMVNLPPIETCCTLWHLQRCVVHLPTDRLPRDGRRGIPVGVGCEPCRLF